MIREFSCSDKETLIGYLYGECSDDESRAVERHLSVCAACTAEVTGFGGVRQALSEWKPPARVPGFRLVADDLEAREAATVLRPARWWRRPLPVWARAAAAVLLIALGAALANVEVRYDQGGVTVSTGWRHPSTPSAAAAPGVQSPAGSAAWQADLAALEGRLRRDFASRETAAPAVVSGPAAGAGLAAFDERQFMARVRALVDDRIGESETRQQREMASRLADFQSDVASQRHADLLRVQQGLGQVGRTGAEVLQQRQLINYLLTVADKR